MATEVRKKENVTVKKRSKVPVIIIALVVVVAALAGVGFYTVSSGSLPDVSAKKGGRISPLTGQISENKLPARPLIVSIDNVGDAVPQSNLSHADMIFEFPVEGLQTRLEAMFYSDFPECFGPIRSTRPYFVDLTREYKGIFLAHGWSPDAESYLKSNVVPYVNAMESELPFYRVSDKEEPHNSYLKWEDMKAKIDREGWWNDKQDLSGFTFMKGAHENTGEKATTISFDYPFSGCEFRYDPETNKYGRWADGTAFVDKENGKQIKVSTIIAQSVSSIVLDEKGRLDIDMCAGGKAILFTNGVAVEGTWTRSGLDSRTEFTDKNGNKFEFAAGKVWVEICDQNCDIKY